ncbi:MAG: glycosyltransferase, partial [Lachnospiraceae bacterium]|nr:glycosyltransferase [Lachnospiraceae bacterium]
MEAKDLRFSIVIPFYNASAYLPRSIGDVLSQTYSDWELLLVDDCSTDEGSRVAENCAAKDERIKVIRHEQNLGVSAARNTGIGRAAGDYLLMLDADDRYEPTLLEKLSEALNEYAADVAVYGFWEEYFDGDQKTYEKIFTAKDICLTEIKEIAHKVYELNKMTMYGYPWNKAYRLSYLREGGYLFGEDSFGEDILFNISVFQNITS